MPKKHVFWAFCGVLRRALFASVLCFVSIVSGAFGDDRMCTYYIYHYCYGGLNMQSLNPPLNGHAIPDGVNISLTGYNIGTGTDFCNVLSSGFQFNGWYCRDEEGNALAVQPSRDDYTFSAESISGLEDCSAQRISCYTQWTTSGAAIIELANLCSGGFPQYLYVDPGQTRTSGVYREYDATSLTNPFSTQMSPLPSPTNPVNVPSDSCFAGYSYYHTNVPVCLEAGGDFFPSPAINSYGELYANGESVAMEYSNGSYHYWSATYLNAAYTIKLDSPGADVGGHGQEFLHYYDFSLRPYVLYNNAYAPSEYSVTLSAGDTIAIPSRTGYTFDGYYSSPTGGKQYVDSTGHITNAAMSALPNMTWTDGYGDSCNVWYAHWKLNVTYDPGTCTLGTTGTAQTFTGDATYGASYTVRGLGTGNNDSGITVNPGFHFNGWVGSSSAANYTSQTYTETQTINPFNIGGDLTLTAQVAGNTTTINFSCGTGTGISGNPPSSQTMTRVCVISNSNNVWDPPELPSTNGCSKTGYTFVGWNCPDISCDGPSGLCVNGRDVSWNFNGPDGGTITCTAEYSANRYNVIYQRGVHGSGADYTDTSAATYDQYYIPKTLSQVGISAESAAYQFADWKGNKTPTGGTTPASQLWYYSGTQFLYQIPGPLTLTAQWTCAKGYERSNDGSECVPITRTVTYSCGAHGTGSPSDPNSPYTLPATVTTLAASVCTPETGYQFKYWVCDNNVGNVNAGNTFSMPAVAVSCVAEWDALISLTWDTNGGSPVSVTSPNSCVIGTTGTITNITQPTRTGYSFLGWEIQ